MTRQLLDFGSAFWACWYREDDGAVESMGVLCEELSERGELIVCCDHPPYKRNEVFAEYKANREEKPQDALDALKATKRLLRSMGWPLMSLKGYEADDVIATLCRHFAPEPVVIHSRDKDLAALVSDRVTLATPEAEMGPAEVKERFGVRPEQIRSWLALAGDASDNIPGAPGIGPTNAATLLSVFDDCVAVVGAAITEPMSIRKLDGFGPSRVAALRDNFKQIDMSYQLAHLEDELPLDFSQLESAI